MGISDTGFDPESLMKDVDLTMIKEVTLPDQETPQEAKTKNIVVYNVDNPTNDQIQPT